MTSTTSTARDRYYAAEDEMDAHVAGCSDCASGDTCPAGFARIQAESLTWEAIKADDPQFAAAYDRARTRAV